MCLALVVDFIRLFFVLSYLHSEIISGLLFFLMCKSGLPHHFDACGFLFYHLST